jgi:hypothetical protein
LPFLAVDFKNVSDVVSLGIVFAVIGLLYVNSNLIHTNPLLNLARYQIFEVQEAEGKTTALITRRSYACRPLPSATVERSERHSDDRRGRSL